MLQVSGFLTLFAKLMHEVLKVSDSPNHTLFVKLMGATDSIMLCRFESLVGDLLNRTQQPCRDCMKDAGVAATDINEVLLVGGMTRMPRVSPLPTIHFFLLCFSLCFVSFSPTLHALFTSCCAIPQLCLIQPNLIVSCCAVSQLCLIQPHSCTSCCAGSQVCLIQPHLFTSCCAVSQLCLIQPHPCTSCCAVLSYSLVSLSTIFHAACVAETDRCVKTY